MTTLTNERLEELRATTEQALTSLPLQERAAFKRDVASAVGELLALRASQPSEETKATVMDALGFMRMRTRRNKRVAAALTELERMGWK